MHKGISFFVALASGACIAAASWIALVPAPGTTLRVNGYDYSIPADDSAEALVSEAIELRSRQLLAEPLYLQADEELLTGTVGTWGYAIDREAATRRALAGVREAHVSASEHFGVWALRRFSSEPESFSMELAFEFDESAGRGRLERLAAAVHREAVDAQLLISEHRIIPSREGRRLSVGATAVRLAKTDPADAVVVESVFERLRPRVTEDELIPVDVTRVLSVYETSFKGKAGPRATNIRRAAKYLDGAVILPGEELSFNEQVGRRVHGRGFVDAPVIVNDELEQDVGGGVCQVATTLHAAAVYGNMEIVRRRSHSRPSGYAPLGLDATVIDGKVDLRIRNPFDEPVLVHASFPSTYVIRVELLGRDPEVKVEHAYSVTHTEPFARRVWRREEAPLGGFQLKQKGSQGMDVVSVLKVKHADGSVARRSYRSKYYPVPEVFWIGEGASPGGLPAMPEDAAGLVIDGEEMEPVRAGEDQEEVPSLEEADGLGREPAPPRDTN